MGADKDMHPPAHRGFTLLEVLVAIFVLAVGILALDAMHLSSVRGNALAGRMSEAMILGRRHLETLSRLPYDHPSLEDRAAGNDFKFPDPQAQLPEHQAREERYTLSWNVGDDVFAPGTKSILLTVTWAEGGGRRCVSLNCLIAPNG
jgi:type IV pilus assembly protein PilV